MTIGSYITQTPLVLPGIILWLDAADTSSVTSVLGSVSFWRDKSGCGNNAIQASGANQPSIGVNTINGLPTITFNGSSKSMAGNLVGFAGKPYTIFVVGQRRSSADFNYLFSTSTTAVNLGWRTNSVIYHQIFLSGVINTVSAINVPSYTSPEPVILAGTQSSNTRNTYLNSLSSNVTNTLANDNGGATQFSLGFFNVYANIDLSEVLVLDRVLSAPQMNLITYYLSNKWGISVT